MLSNTNRKVSAFVIWCIKELEDIKMLFSIIKLHREINQALGISTVFQGFSGATLLTRRSLSIFSSSNLK